MFQRHLLGSVVLATVAALVANAAFAGDKEKKDEKKKEEFKAMMPGPEHKVLAQLTGTFDAAVKFYGPGGAGESKGTMKRTMILGGRFLREDFAGDMMGQKFQGIGTVGFDPAKKKYLTTWIDNMSLGIMTYEGTFDAATKTLTSLGEDVWEGKKMKARDVLKIVSADQQTFEMYRSVDGKEFKVMDISYTRKAEVKKKKEK